MRNTIQIVGMGYHTPNPSETLQQMQQEEAEVSLVSRQDPLYGAVVMCLYGTEYVGTEEAVAAQIAPCFLGDELEARKFLNRIRGLHPTAVTREVRRLVKDGKIADEDKGTHLWEPLYQNGYYPCLLPNWNKQVAAYNFTT